MQMKEDALSSNTVLAFDKEEWQKVGTLAIKVVTIEAVMLTSELFFFVDCRTVIWLHESSVLQFF